MRGQLLMIPQVTISHGEHEEIETGTKRERAMALASSNLRLYQVWFVCTSPRGLNPGSWPEKARVIRQVQNQSVVCGTHSESPCISGSMVDPGKPGDSPTRPVLKREIHLSPPTLQASSLKTDSPRYLCKIKTSRTCLGIAFLHLLPAASRFRFCSRKQSHKCYNDTHSTALFTRDIKYHLNNHALLGIAEAYEVLRRSI
jgi:hypothetical protein